MLRDQAYLLTKQIVADHERSRRENAIHYLFEWNRGLLQANSLARRLAEGLTDDQTRNLVNEKPLRLNANKKSLLLGVLSNVPPEGLQESNGEILLGEKEVSDIRWHLVRYLNNLESIFTAVRHNVADKQIMVEQFEYLVSPQEGYHLLKKFRDALGPRGFPALGELEQELAERHKAPVGRGPVVDQSFRASG